MDTRSMRDAHNKEPIQKIRTNIPRKRIAKPQSQFPHSCVCERFIYSHHRSAYSPDSPAGNMWTDPGCSVQGCLNLFHGSPKPVSGLLTHGLTVAQTCSKPVSWVFTLAAWVFKHVMGFKPVSWGSNPLHGCPNLKGFQTCYIDV